MALTCVSRQSKVIFLIGLATIGRSSSRTSLISMVVMWVERAMRLLSFFRQLRALIKSGLLSVVPRGFSLLPRDCRVGETSFALILHPTSLFPSASTPVVLSTVHGKVNTLVKQSLVHYR